MFGPKKADLSDSCGSQSIFSLLSASVTQSSCLQVLEGLLDDDEDMQQMYLGRREREREMDRAAAAEQNEAGSEDGFSDGGTIPEGDEEGEDNEQGSSRAVSQDLPRITNSTSMTQPVETPFSNTRHQVPGTSHSSVCALKAYQSTHVAALPLHFM